MPMACMFEPGDTSLSHTSPQNGKTPHKQLHNSHLCGSIILANYIMSTQVSIFFKTQSVTGFRRRLRQNKFYRPISTAAHTYELFFANDFN